MWTNPAAGSTSPLRSSDGKAVKGYGYRVPIKTMKGVTAPFHAGVDISGPVGTPVVSAGPGKVVHAGEAGTGLAAGRSGLSVLVAHPDGSGTYYGHLDRVLVRRGQFVDAGDLLGPMGATGRVTGPHLHFEVRPRSGALATTDPILWAVRRSIRLGAAPPKPEPVRKDENMASFIQGDESPKVYATDWTSKRHVPNPTILAAMLRVSGEVVHKVPQAVLDSLPDTGPSTSVDVDAVARAVADLLARRLAS